MLSHTGTWGARQGIGRALTVLRSGSAGWVVLLSLRTRAASPELHPSTLYPAVPSLLAGQRRCLGFPGWAKQLVYSLPQKQGVNFSIIYTPSILFGEPLSVPRTNDAARCQAAGRRCREGDLAESGAQQ